VLTATLVVGACAGVGETAKLPSQRATDAAASIVPAPVATTVAAPTSTAGISVTLETTVTAGEVVLRIVGPVRRGQLATVSDRTAPNAECSITVTSAAGRRVETLGAKGDGGTGSVLWSWTVEADATPGAWPVEVSCLTVSGIRAIARDLLRRWSRDTLATTFTRGPACA